MPKFRKKLIIQFQENAQREERTGGRIDRGMDEPNSLKLSGNHRGSN